MKPLRTQDGLLIACLLSMFIIGVAQILFPGSFYKRDNLTPDEIARKNRDRKWKGYFFTTFAAAIIALILMPYFL